MNEDKKPLVNLMVQIDGGLKQKIKVYAATKGISMRDVVILALKKLLGEQ